MKGAYRPADLEKVVLVVEGEHVRPHDGGARVEGEDVPDERIPAALKDHHVGDLDHRILLRLREDSCQHAADGLLRGRGRGGRGEEGEGGRFLSTRSGRSAPGERKGREGGRRGRGEDSCQHAADGLLRGR